MFEKLKGRLQHNRKSVKPSLEARTLYVNLEIPPEELDDFGQPRQYLSNRINTAKYTWYTFLPKNLFEQFRGIANLYFLFLVILQMFPLFSTSASPVLVVLPLAAILILTGAKDAVEDNKRHQTDESVNKAITYSLSDWKNVNVPVYKVSRWKRIINKIKSVFINKNKNELERTNSQMSHLEATKARSFRESLRSSTGSFSRVFLKKKRGMPYRPGQVPHSVLRRSHLPTEKEKKKRHSTARQPLDKRWRKTLWEDIKVGDLVCLRNDDPIPADMAVLSSSEPEGLCYVETQNLDGETNLKIKRSLQATNEIRSPDDCDTCQFYVESESPNPNLYSYNGVLKWKIDIQPSNSWDDLDPIRENNSMDDDDSEEVLHEKSEAITGNSVLLRGCVLRNTGWVIGMVLFTGNETKIMLNSGKTPSKRSKMEKQTNPYVIANFVLLLVLCLICAIAASLVYENNTSSLFFEVPDAESATMEGFIMFWTTLVIYQNIIPISLYISVQIVKTAAAYFIHIDLEMYNSRLDQVCIPKTWNISDDLGQIEYIFSDKTGTLTQNIMEFRRCTINGVAYGLGDTEAAIGSKMRENEAAADSARITQKIDLEKARSDMLNKQRELFDHKYINPNSTFVDPQMFDDIAQQDEQSQSVVHFFSALALCHTVLPELPDPDNNPNLIDYKAQSPDEAALVATARDMGFTFVEREKDNVVVDIMGEQRSMTLLNVLEFNSTRKRMSVIMQNPLDGKIVLLCKGADSVIYERLAQDIQGDPETVENQKRVREETLDHLALFANEGLRTLCIASRMLDEDEYKQWAARYHTASNAISNRDEQIESVCEEIECNLTLIGGTAIEDKLQVGVPDTIAVLAEAGIKIWVLTGDKVETAINIGFACNLLTKDMLLISVNARSEEETVEQLANALNEVGEKSKTQKCALVIDGESLKYALEGGCKQELLNLGTQCRAVICCRVSPMQKAKVVNMVKKGLKVMTLAIGDGANDVSMIQEANVGVGISGEEGRQAVMASDYAIAQFSYLGKLLLVHGRWSYLRTSEMILTFFYKNIMWTLVLFWYQLFCGFSGTMMFDYSYITLYNLVFTSLPCIFAGIFDQDLKAEYSFKFPQLYLMGIRNDKFTTPKFYLTVFDAIYQSAVCFGLPYMIFIGPKLGTDGYDTEGVYEFGTFIAGIAVVVANVLVGFTIFSWTWIMFLCIFISCATFFIWTGIYSNIMSFTFYGENILFHQGNFWLCLILTFAICLIPRFATKYFLHMYRPFDNDIVRELVLCNAYSPSSHFLRKKDRYTDDEMEESLPINLSRTRSVVSSDQQSQIQMNDIDTEGRHVLYRSTTQQSTKSEIMNMRTGKRASFMGFAYSTDDNNVFDEYRQSVYRTHIGSTPNLAHRQSIVSLNNDDTGDWMPIDGFKLRHYETDPSILSSGKKSTSLGKKLVKAMKNRMSHRPNNLLDESDNMLVPVTPPTDIQPLQPFLLHQHNESSHHEPSHQPHSPHY